MYDIKIKPERFSLLFGSIFAGVGIFITVIFLFLTITVIKDKDAMDGETRVLNYTTNCHRDDEGSYMCSPIFTYEVEGQVYSCSSNSSTSSSNFDKYKTIYYDTKNPSDCVSEYEVSTAKFFGYFIALPVVFIVIGLIFIINAFKRVKKLKKLNQVGVLYKNLPYTMVASNVSINNNRLPAIQVNFTFPNGESKLITGTPRHDGKTGDADGMVDVLIDPNDYNNYYIDFEINQKY